MYIVFFKVCYGSLQKTYTQTKLLMVESSRCLAETSITEAQHPRSSTEVRQIGGGAEGQEEEQGFKETFFQGIMVVDS